MVHPWWLPLHAVAEAKDEHTNKLTNRQTDKQTNIWTWPLRKAPLRRGLNNIDKRSTLASLHFFHSFAITDKAFQSEAERCAVSLRQLHSSLCVDR